MALKNRNFRDDYLRGYSSIIEKKHLQYILSSEGGEDMTACLVTNWFLRRKGLLTYTIKLLRFKNKNVHAILIKKIKMIFLQHGLLLGKFVCFYIRVLLRVFIHIVSLLYVNISVVQAVSMITFKWKKPINYL